MSAIPPDIFTIIQVVLIGTCVIFLSVRLWRLRPVLAESKRLEDELRALEPEDEETKAFRRHFGTRAVLWRSAKLFFWSLIASFWVVRLLGQHIGIPTDAVTPLVILLAVLPPLVYVRMKTSQLKRMTAQLQEQNHHLEDLVEKFTNLNQNLDRLGEEIEAIGKEMEHTRKESAQSNGKD